MEKINQLIKYLKSHSIECYQEGEKIMAFDVYKNVEGGFDKVLLELPVDYGSIRSWLGY